MPRPARRASRPSRRWCGGRRPLRTPMSRWSRRTRIRVGLSQYERARVAARAAERGVFASEEAALLRALRQREPAEAVADPRLPRDLSRARRLAALSGAPARAARARARRADAGGRRPAVAAALAAGDPRTPEAELAILARAVQGAAAGAAAAGGEIRPGVRLADALSGQTLTLRLTGEGVSRRSATRAPAAPRGRVAGLAEREGFEPSRRFPAYTLSRRAPSTTRPPLRAGGQNHLRRRFASLPAERAPIVRVPTNRRKFAHRQIGAFAASSQGGRPITPTLKQATRA